MLWLPGRRLHHGRIPEGLIIPLDSVSIPDDWERFTAPDGKHIVGSGSTYSPGATGGDDNNFSVASTAAGSHSGSLVDGWAEYYSGGAIQDWGVTGSSENPGNHSHTIGFDYEHTYQQIILIRALSDRSIFPASAIVLSKEGTAPHEDLTICYNAGKVFRSGASITSGGGSISNVADGQAGGHDHSQRGWGIYNEYPISLPGAAHLNVGNHNHGIQSYSLSDWELKRAYLTAWKGTSGFSLASAMIGMWESSTPPSGWILCDGTNGTLNLRDYFIMLSTVGTAGGQYNESNRILPSITLSSQNWNHKHKGTVYENTSIETQRYHESLSVPHNHTYNSWINYTPEYYALTFIQRI